MPPEHPETSPASLRRLTGGSSGSRLPGERRRWGSGGCGGGAGGASREVSPL